MVSAAAARARSFEAVLRGGVPELASVAPYALMAVIGVELAALAALLPDTLRLGWHHPTADFRNLYGPARDLSLVGLYSPFLAVLLHPVTYLGELSAFRAMFVINVAASLTIAWIAQAPLRTPEARLAVALGVLTVPQLHWAVRLGHLTPALGLIALCGLLLVQRHSYRGAIVLALLSLKPQYAVAPFLQLLRDRRFAVAGAMLGAAGTFAVVGFAVIGPAELGEYLSIAFDWGPDSRDNLLPVQQSWLYSWPGVQISFGIAPQPLITFQLMALSLATVGLAWANAGPMTRACVTAFAMLLLTPYAQFYDFGMVVVGIALLLRCGFDARLTAGISATLWIAAAVTQAHTIFPTKDALGAAQTAGPYVLTPAVLGAVALIAVIGKQRPPGGAQW